MSTMDGEPQDQDQGTNAYDHLMKILIIGDSGSNKRRLLGKYLRDDELTDTTTLGTYNLQHQQNSFRRVTNSM